MNSSRSLTIRWLGAAHFELGDGSHALNLDPWTEGNPGCPVNLADIASTDAVVVTHGHPGHYGRGDALKLALLADAPFVGPPALIEHLIGTRALPRRLAQPIEVGERFETSIAVVEAFEIPHPPVRHEFTTEDVPGEPNYGYIVRTADTNVVHVGDTTPAAIYEEIGAMMRVDVACLPLWAAEMVWTEDEALDAMVDVIAALKPEIVIPHARFRESVTTPQASIKRVKSLGLRTSVRPMRPGERLTL